MIAAETRDTGDDPLAQLIERAHSVSPARLLDAVRDAATRLGAIDVQLLFADFAQQELIALDATDPSADGPRPVPIEGSTAGQAFIRCAPVTTPLPGGGVLVSAPLLDGVERLGVLQLSFPNAAATSVPSCRRFADLVCQYVSTKGRITDEFHRLRATELMSLAAQMQWQMLPPLTGHSPEVTIAGQVEPAYHVGGDAFDYAVNRDRAQLAIFDAMGHGVSASVTTALAIGAYRSSRRRGDDLLATLRIMDTAIAGEFPDERFVTALLAELDLTTGRIRFLNAGHLQPLLLRGRHTVTLPDVPAGLPLGLGGLLPAAADRVVDYQLEPGDRVVMVTDGILDATNRHGERFGERRMIELAEHAAHAQLPLAELARNIARGVYDYQAGELSDDASLLLLEYTGGGTAPPPATAPRPRA